jgi:hypothetical protein
MHEQSPGRPALTDMQFARLDYARRDYEAARTTDLADLDAAGLILLVEHLRGRLGDALNLFDEVCGTTPPARG